MNADRSLLFGILALQLNFIDRQALLAAFDVWITRKSRSLGEILIEAGKLDPTRYQLLDALVEEHLKQHGNDPKKSLAAVSSISSVRNDLENIADPELQASLVGVAGETLIHVAAANPFPNCPPSAGASASSGMRFTILRPHAKGGLGQVSVALDQELNREVAFKEIQARYADDPASRSRFLLEAEVTGKLEHPSIVPVYGLGTYGDGRPFYAMRFVEGDSLQDAIQRFHAGREQGTGDRSQGIETGEKGTRKKKNVGEPETRDASAPHPAIRAPRFSSLEFRQLLGRFIDVCNAIGYAHSRRVLHRDLKPNNVMLGKYGETLVVDWGLAKALGHRESENEAGERTLQPASGSGSAQTQMGSAIGTPQYMSPEQADGRLDELGPATDIYSLGATLYCLLTGRAPFADSDVWTTLAHVSKGDFAPPRAIKSDVPPALQAICLKAMALKPEDRYVSARALASDVEHWLADEPVTALRETAAERLARWGRKHRAFVRAGVAAALLVAIVSAAALVVVDHQRRATANALVAETKAKNAETAAKNAETQAKIAELAQRQRAEARETQAIDAVKRFRDAVANEPELKNSPQLEELRKRLLKEPLAFFKDLRERIQGDNDARPESLARLASASFDLGLLTNEIGDQQDAFAAYESALAIRQKLADTNPTNTRYQGDLAATHNNIGLLLRKIGKPDEALAAHESALAIWRKLARDNPTDAKFQGVLARGYNNIAGLLSDTGKPAEALVAHESALAIRQKLADGNPNANDYQSDLAQSQSNIGVLLQQTGKLAEAHTVLASALAIRQKLADENSSVTEFQSALAGSHESMGYLLSYTGKPAEALMSYSSALTILQKLAQDNPTNTAHLSGLARIHDNVGLTLSKTGKVTEALAAYESALAILRKLADDNPTVTDFQSALATSHHNIGALLSQTGKPTEALAAYESALAIRQKLADNNPAVIQFQSNLATTHNSIGILLSGNWLNDIQKPAEALVAYETALAIRQKLADDNPSVIQFQRDLANSHNNIGLLLKNTGKQAEAIAAYKSALAIQQRLTDENPKVTEFQSELASCHSNIGALLRETGKAADALASYEAALAIRQKLSREHPESPLFATLLAATLHSLATFDLNSQRFDLARSRLRQAVELQRQAVAANIENRFYSLSYRRLLEIFLTDLIKAAQGLGDADEVAEAELRLAELRDTDPAFAAVDARLATIVKGDQQPTDEAERLALAQRAYDKRLFAAAARLWIEAFDANTALADDRQAQHRYNAACCAALAAAGQGRDDPPPDEAAKAKFRQQALAWLQAELAAWTSVVATADGPLRGAIAGVLAHWQHDTDLTVIRDSDALAKLPDDERESLSQLWACVASLRERAENKVEP